MLNAYHQLVQPFSLREVLDLVECVPCGEAPSSTIRSGELVFRMPNWNDLVNDRGSSETNVLGVDNRREQSRTQSNHRPENITTPTADDIREQRSTKAAVLLGRCISRLVLSGEDVRRTPSLVELIRPVGSFIFGHIMSEIIRRATQVETPVIHGATPRAFAHVCGASAATESHERRRTRPTRRRSVMLSRDESTTANLLSHVRRRRKQEVVTPQQ